MDRSLLRRFASEKTLFYLSALIILLMPVSEVTAEVLSHFHPKILPSIFHPFFFGLYGVIGTLAAVLYKFGELTDEKNRGKWYAPDVFYLLMILFMVISAVFSVNPGMYARDYLLNSENPLDFLGYFSLFYAGSRIKSPQYRKKLIVVILIVEVMHGIAAFFQTFNIQIAYSLLTWHSGSAYGLTPNSNYYGGLSVFMLACVSGVYLFPELFGAKKPVKVLSVVFAGFVFYTMMGSRARLTWPGFAAMVLFYLVSGLVMLKSNIDRAKLKRYFIRLSVLFAVFAAVFAVTHLFTDYITEEVTRTQMEVDGKFDSGIGSDRLLLWMDGLESVPRHWATGIGLDNYYQVFIEKYGGADHAFFRAKAHNEFINTLVTQGVFAFAFYMFVFVRTAVINVKKVFSSDDDETRAIRWLFLAMFITYLAQAFFNTSVRSVAPHFWLVLGLLNTCESPLTLNNKK